MKSKVLMAIAMVAVFFAAVFMIVDNDQSEATTEESIRVWIQDSYGEMQMTTVYASTVRGVIEAAADNLGIDIEYDDLGKIVRVDGVGAEEGEYWNIHQWMPYGYYDWTSVGFDERSDSWLISGTSYCLHKSGKTLEEGTLVYGKPDFRPESEGYVFIRFTKEYDSDSEYIRDVFTSDMRRNGFWIKGHGSNWGEVLTNAMESNGFQCEFTTTVDGNGNDLQYWFLSFFGLNDQSLGDKDSWAYWSQWIFKEGEWKYNDFTIGYYDPAVYKYLACVYIQSYDESKDLGGDMPDPEVDAPTAMSINQNVKFVANGKVIGETTVHYGKSLTADQIPDYQPDEGYEFLGWGDTTIAITEDTTFEAKLKKTSATVTFISDGRTFQIVDVEPGGKVTMDSVPKKQESYASRYEFLGWSRDVSSANPVIEDLDSLVITDSLTLHACFKEIKLDTKTVTFIVGDSTTTFDAVVGKQIPDDKVPKAPEGYTLTGWSDDINQKISAEKTFTATLKRIVLTVTYLDSTGAVWKVEEVSYGEAASESGNPSKDSTEDYTYSFSHWAVEGSTAKADLSSVKSNLTLTPVYDEVLIEKCKVSFSLNGEVISTVKVVKGDKLSKSQIPDVDVPDTQIFSGWVGTDEAITEDREFTATLVDKVYNSVKFVTYDDSVIHYEDVEDGKYSTYSETPIRPDSEYASYTFVGWTKEPSAEDPKICILSETAITGDTVFTAVFKENRFPTSKVTFMSEGKVISEVDVVTGRAIDQSKVPVPEKEGYSFKGWDKDIDSVITVDTTFTAEFEILVLTVTYKDWDGKVLNEEDVEYGSSAKYSVVPSRSDSEYSSYSFSRWAYSYSDTIAADLTSIKKDTVVYAVFNEYFFPTSTVSFILNEDTISVVNVVTGRTLKDSQIPDPSKEGYIFSGWGAGVYSEIDDDVTFTATLTIIKLKVMFYSEDGSLIDTEDVEYGSPSTSGIIPSKDKTQKYTYVFKGWSLDPNAETVVIEDLSSIKKDMKLKPVFESVLNKYAVSFCDYDRSVIKTVYVEYGKAVSDYPDTPSREQSVDKVFSFKGWSISPLGWKESDLGNITESKTTYAYYDYTVRQYLLEIFDGDKLIRSMDVDYGSFLNESVFMTTVDNHLVRLYRNPDCTRPVDTSYSFSGYTKLYAVVIPGHYGYQQSGSTENRNTVQISFDQATASELKGDGTVIIADLSQFSSGKTVSVDFETVCTLYEVLGEKSLKFILTKGNYEVSLRNLYDVMSEGGHSEFTISMNNGPTSLVKVNAALKKVNCDSLLSLSVNLDGMPADTGSLTITAYIPYEKDSNELNEPRVWSVNAGTGVLIQMGCSYSDGYLKVVLCDNSLYAIGTAFQRSDESDTSDPSPYGEVTTEWHSGESNAVDITNMRFDGSGHVLFVPSYYNGSIVIGIKAGAFSGVTNTSTIVIPDTVRFFDWNSLMAGSVTTVYFLGTIEEFSGEVPANVSVFVLNGVDGWNDYAHDVFFEESYKYNNGAVLNYYLIGDEIIICGYSGGSEVKIPSNISVNGMEYPVTIIGPDAFMGTSVKSMKISETVREIQSRAFLGSKLTTITWANNSSLVSICDGAFKDCSSLRLSSVPDGVRFIGNDAFMNCRMIASMTVPDSVEVLGERAFYNCIKLSSITLGSGLSEIKDGTFAYCSILDNVYLPDQIVRIGNEAFMNCRILTSIDTNCVKSIGDNAFRSCESLVSVVLNKDLEMVGDGALSNTPLLASITAYCAQPEGFSEAFTSSIPDDLELVVNYDVSSSWAIPHTIQEKEDDLTESFESRTMPYVIGGMIVLFIVLGIYCFRHRVI